MIINPIAGGGFRAGSMRRRIELAAAWLSDRGVAHEIFLTERRGHAADIARAGIDRGATMVCAWGGDGTINEVASVLAFGAVPLAIIPSGSGNGLARELRIPADPLQALAVALDGQERSIDVGELGGRLFFNIAGIGFDALVAARFSEHGTRGFASYLKIALLEMRRYEPAQYTVTLGDRRSLRSAWMIVLANSRQYGSGALIAPLATPDDGQLDLVIVHGLPAWQIARRLPRLFNGTLRDEPGVLTMTRVCEMSVAADSEFPAHVDGEPLPAIRSVAVRVYPRTLKVRAPSSR